MVWEIVRAVRTVQNDNCVAMITLLYSFGDSRDFIRGVFEEVFWVLSSSCFIQKKRRKKSKDKDTFIPITQ